MAIDMLRGIPFDYEPKRENRFYAEFPTELGIASFLIQEFKRPSLKINSTPIPWMNTTYYVAGKYNWEEMDIVFIDVIGPSTSQSVMEWIRLHAESISGREGYASSYQKTIILKQLDPTGVEIDKWTLENCQITSVDFGKNSYDSDDWQKISITIQPQRCIHNI